MGRWGTRRRRRPSPKSSARKALRFWALTFPGHGARQGRDEALNPWTVVPELLAVVDWARVRWDSISLQANSIGAYFAMLALDAPDKALLLSPILDMERLILDMMGWAKVTERELSEKGEIATSFGQTLSWAYLCYVREYPVHNWQCPICILYTGQDNMTSRQTVEEFTLQHGAQLTIMDNGEHWFHTLEQREVLQSMRLSQVLCKPSVWMLWTPSGSAGARNARKSPSPGGPTGPISAPISSTPRRCAG